MKINDILHFLIIPAIIGILGAVAAIIFRLFIKFFNIFFNTINFIHTKYFYIISIPIIFFITYKIIEKLKIDPSNVTVDNVAKKIALLGGKFSVLKGMVVLFLTSISIGAGMPIGREGPIAKLGALLSDILLNFLKISRENFQIYLTTGVSAAIAATFNAPIAGVILGLEIVIGKINTYIIIPMIVAVATSTSISRIFLGDYPAFLVPHLSYNSNYLYLIATFEAIIIGLMALFFNKSIKFLEKSKTKPYRYKIIIILGILTALIITFIPQSAGVGYEYVTELFQNQYTYHNSILIAVAKLFGTIFTLGSGLFGGIMSPSIFIGAFSGFAIGDYFQFIHHIDPRIFALIGSAAMLAGVTKTPLRSSVIITELTHSYQLLIPILITSAITTLITSTFDRGSYFRRSLLQKGIDIENENISFFLENINIEKYISPVPSITKNTSIKRAIQVFNISHSRYLPVTQNRILVGIVSLRDIRKSQLTLKKVKKVKEIMTKNPYHLTNNYTKNDILKILSHLEKDYIPYTNEEGIYLGMIDMNKLLKDLTFSIQKNKMCL